MNTIDVCLSPDLMHLYDVKSSTVVVVDILRATSCMTTALANGVAGIRPFSSLDECRRMKEKGYFIAGERDGLKVDGFDLGNSPFEYMEERLKGQRVAFTTTNGTHAIVAARGAREIIVGSFLNLSAVCDHLRGCETNILIICSGWKGKVNLEDTLFAGALVDQLNGNHRPDCDAPVMAQDLYTREKGNLMAFLKNSSHVKRLERLHIQKDIEFCLTPDRYDVVPVLLDGEIVVEGGNRGIRE